jgi:hypothetical protein
MTLPIKGNMKLKIYFVFEGNYVFADKFLLHFSSSDMFDFRINKKLSVAPTWHWLFFALNFSAVTFFKIYLFLYVTSKISANHDDVANHASYVSSFMPKK